MARILVCNAQRHRAERCHKAKFIEELCDVLHHGRKFLSRLMRRVAVGEKFVVFLESRPTTRRIGDDGIEACGQKDILIRPRQVASDIADTGMRCERAATDLITRDDYFAAVGLENANGGSIQLAERDLRDAARKKRDAGATRPLGGKRLAKFREKEIRIDLRHQTVAFLQAQEPQDSSSTRKSSQAAALIDFQRPGGRGDTARIRQQAAIHEIAHDSRKKWPLVLLLNLRAGAFE